MESLSDFNQKLNIALKTENTMRTPYISMNKLAEYMTAKATRRRSLVTVLKKDADAPKSFYSEVRNLLPSYLKSSYDTDLIDVCLEKIKGKPNSTTWQITDNSISILALENLKETELPDLTNYEILPATVMTIKSIEMGGVTVGIRPDVYLTHKTSGKKGALKIHFAKDIANRLEHPNRVYAATLLKYAFVLQGMPEKEIDINACISLDVFLNAYSTASPSYKQMVNEMTIACEEIALWWYKD